MGYLHIDNLYKNQEILMFKECYAMEKIHGTSAHITYKDNKLSFFAGVSKHETFCELFDKEELIKTFEELSLNDVTVYGEAYGGKLQGMSGTYGKELKFIAFDVQIGFSWLNVPDAEQIVKDLRLEFVDYNRIPTSMIAIDAERIKRSTQAIRNGIEESKIREGIVLRPIIELKKNNGVRIIAKHKNDEFKETQSKRKVISPENQKVWTEAKEIAEEWVTPMRVSHVLDKIEAPCMEKMREIILAMVEDIKREGSGEIEWSKSVNGAIGKRTAYLVKQYFKNKINKEIG
ncbi:hypothetical protein LCGC14_0862480 [marine sediment metagenome]|uniref:RNA ligase domain-containing protein n=1 Tax=marine sediment metagenome TaxID=412755 RepID=A0A0F9PC02_9ZZZZ